MRMGKKPAMKYPALGSPAKKRWRSPVTTVPSAATKLPNANQMKVLRM